MRETAIIRISRFFTIGRTAQHRAKAAHFKTLKAECHLFRITTASTPAHTRKFSSLLSIFTCRQGLLLRSFEFKVQPFSDENLGFFTLQILQHCTLWMRISIVWLLMGDRINVVLVFDLTAISTYSTSSLLRKRYLDRSTVYPYRHWVFYTAKLDYRERDRCTHFALIRHTHIHYLFALTRAYNSPRFGCRALYYQG